MERNCCRSALGARFLFRLAVLALEISWDEVQEAIDHLYAETARFPFDGLVYTLR